MLRCQFEIQSSFSKFAPTIIHVSSTMWYNISIESRKRKIILQPVECEKENRSITRWEKEYILMVRPREENLFLCFSNSKFQTPARKLNQYWHELNPVYITILNPDFPRTIELVPGNIRVEYFFFSRRANFCNPFFKRINSISSRRRELEGIIRAKSRGDGRKVGQE